MNQLKISLSLLFIFLIAGCATFSKFNNSEKEQLLIEHLESWQEFQADGIISVNYQNFVFRKNINIKKTVGSMKLTIYDSGIFGMKPEPFLTARIDSLVKINSMDSEKTAIFKLDQFPGITFLRNPMQILEFKNQIISNASFNPSDSTFIYFSQDMKITNIKQNSKAINIDFLYETDLTGIHVWQDETDLIKIEIDKITRNRVEN
jgi:hypothetical protein